MRPAIAALAAGALLVAVGIGLVYVPAGVIAAGVLALGAGVALLPVGGGRR